MNLANRLTLIRILFIPFYVFFVLTNFVPYSNYIAFVIFAVASLTDYFDGYIARKYNMITNFGKFMDPLADKLLVCSALICFVQTVDLSPVIVIIIIGRELIINGFRLIASLQGNVISASYYGKFKTGFHIAMILMYTLHYDNYYFRILEWIVTGIALILTLISLFDYIFKNISVLKEGGKE